MRTSHQLKTPGLRRFTCKPGTDTVKTVFKIQQLALIVQLEAVTSLPHAWIVTSECEF